MTTEATTDQTATDSPEALLGAITDANDEWHAIENSVSVETNPHTLYGWITGALFSAGWRLRPQAAATDEAGDDSEPLVPMSEHVDVVLEQGWELVAEQMEAESARRETERLRAELADAREEIESRRMHDEATTYHLNVALWLHAEAREEIAKLQHSLDVAEPHEADVRLEVEADVRADLAAKAGA